MWGVGEYRRSSDAVYRLRYHFVFVTKYRKPVLRGEVAQEVRSLTREVCQFYDIEIVKGHIRPDHVHLLFIVGRASEVGAEPSDAGDQGQDAASFIAGVSKTANGVLGSASLGERLFCGVDGRCQR